jgi:hypothetical protein
MAPFVDQKYIKKDTKPSMSAFLLKLTSKCTWRQARSPPMIPYPPSLHTVYVCTVNLLTQGWGGGGGELTREKVRGAMVYNAGRKYQHD